MLKDRTAAHAARPKREGRRGTRGLAAGARNLSLGRRKRFLVAYAKCGVVAVACRSIAVGRRTVYAWLEQDERFRAQFEDALEQAADLLEHEARRRATEGVLEPVFYRGRQCGSVRKYSDTLLLALLNAYRPERFKYRHEHVGSKGGPIGEGHVVVYLPDNRRDPALKQASDLAPASGDDP